MVKINIMNSDLILKIILGLNRNSFQKVHSRIDLHFSIWGGGGGDWLIGEFPKNRNLVNKDIQEGIRGPWNLGRLGSTFLDELVRIYRILCLRRPGKEAGGGGRGGVRSGDNFNLFIAEWKHIFPSQNYCNFKCQIAYI